MRPDGPRDPFAGPESGPDPPFPIKLSGPVIKGFGRGSKELGIPTANIPSEGLSAFPSLATGVYYGFSALQLSSSNTPQIYPSVLSIGYNPFYKNTVRSVEIHILHKFDNDFYGASLNLFILGFIRPEHDYVSVDALIDDIKTDCEVARRSLERSAYQSFKDETGLINFDWAKNMNSEDVQKMESEVLAKGG